MADFMVDFFFVEETSIETALCFFIVPKSCAVTFAVMEKERETDSD